MAIHSFGGLSHAQYNKLTFVTKTNVPKCIRRSAANVKVIGYRIKFFFVNRKVITNKKMIHRLINYYNAKTKELNRGNRDIVDTGKIDEIFNQIYATTNNKKLKSIYKQAKEDYLEKQKEFESSTDDSSSTESNSSSDDENNSSMNQKSSLFSVTNPKKSDGRANASHKKSDSTKSSLNNANLSKTAKKSDTKNKESNKSASGDSNKTTDSKRKPSDNKHSSSRRSNVHNDSKPKPSLKVKLKPANQKKLSKLELWTSENDNFIAAGHVTMKDDKLISHFAELLNIQTTVVEEAGEYLLMKSSFISALNQDQASLLCAVFEDEKDFILENNEKLKRALKGISKEVSDSDNDDISDLEKIQIFLTEDNSTYELQTIKEYYLLIEEKIREKKDLQQWEKLQIEFVKKLSAEQLDALSEDDIGDDGFFIAHNKEFSKLIYDETINFSYIEIIAVIKVHWKEPLTKFFAKKLIRFLGKESEDNILEIFDALKDIELESAFAKYLEESEVREISDRVLDKPWEDLINFIKKLNENNINVSFLVREIAKNKNIKNLTSFGAYEIFDLIEKISPKHSHAFIQRILSKDILLREIKLYNLTRFEELVKPLTEGTSSQGLSKTDPITTIPASTNVRSETKSVEEATWEETLKLLTSDNHAKKDIEFVAKSKSLDGIQQEHVTALLNLFSFDFPLQLAFAKRLTGGWDDAIRQNPELINIMGYNQDFIAGPTNLAVSDFLKLLNENFNQKLFFNALLKNFIQKGRLNELEYEDVQKINELVLNFGKEELWILLFKNLNNLQVRAVVNEIRVETLIRFIKRTKDAQKIDEILDAITFDSAEDSKEMLDALSFLGHGLLDYNSLAQKHSIKFITVRSLVSFEEGLILDLCNGKGEILFADVSKALENRDYARTIIYLLACSYSTNFSRAEWLSIFNKAKLTELIFIVKNFSLNDDQVRAFAKAMLNSVTSQSSQNDLASSPKNAQLESNLLVMEKGSTKSKCVASWFRGNTLTLKDIELSTLSKQEIYSLPLSEIDRLENRHIAAMPWNSLIHVLKRIYSGKNLDTNQLLTRILKLKSIQELNTADALFIYRLLHKQKHKETANFLKNLSGSVFKDFLLTEESSAILASYKRTDFIIGLIEQYKSFLSHELIKAFLKRNLDLEKDSRILEILASKNNI